MIRYLVFSFSEALTNLWRSRVLNVLSIGTIMLAMFILGSFLFLGHNLRAISLGWKKNIQFHVFLFDQVSDSDLKAIQAKLNASPLVESSEFISKSEAKERFEHDFGSYRDVSKSLDQNPFPASFRVTLSSDQESQSAQTLRQDLQSHAGVEEVYYDRDVFEQLAFVGSMIEFAGWFFGAIMVFASVFTISNVLKLTFFARREEVDIMKLVGASRAYIRGPFVIEGLLQGLVGATIGVSVLALGFGVLTSYLQRNPTNLLAELDLVFLPNKWLLLLVAAGCLSGVLGAVFSLNQFLEEHISYQ